MEQYIDNLKSLEGAVIERVQWSDWERGEWSEETLKLVSRRPHRQDEGRRHALRYAHDEP